MPKANTAQPIVFQTSSFSPRQKVEIDSFVRGLQAQITALQASNVAGAVGTSLWTNARLKVDGDNTWFQVKDRVDGLWRTVYTVNGIWTTEKDGEQ
jgi:hypothetical protein